MSTKPTPRPLTPKEMLLAAELLDLASEEASNHSCNDFNLNDYASQTGTFSREEIDAFVKEQHEVNGDPEEFDPEEDNADTLPDWSVMSHLAEKLRATAKAETKA